MNSTKEGHNNIRSINSFYIRKLNHTTGQGGSMPLTKVTVHCFFFLESGTVKINVDEREIIISKNDCLIIPMGQVFSVINCSEDAQGYMGGFHPDFLMYENGTSFIYGWLSRPVSLEGKKVLYIQNIFSRIYDEWTSQNKDMSIIRVYLQALISEMNYLNSSVSTNYNGAAHEITGKFIQCLSSGNSNCLTVEEYSKKLGITPSHLTKCVKQVTGKPPLKWIKEKIMTEAKMLLCQTELPIGDVSAKVGILDSSYFSRLFKKNEGITPLDFRKLTKKS